MIESLNSDCFCVSLDAEALRRAIESDPAIREVHDLLAERCPHLFSALPFFVSRTHVDQMAGVVHAVERAVALPAFRETVLARAPAIARHDPGNTGVFMGYDFHLGASGPRLIEINTNAGGALLNVLLGRAQRACCDDIRSLVSGPIPFSSLEREFFDTFVREWRAAGRAGLPSRIAIVDERPEEQFLYPEFLLFTRLFQRFGVEAVVRAPGELRFEDGSLRDAHGRLDMIYNRLTDFYFEAGGSAALRDAYLMNAAVVTPHPRAHALYADKRNLSLLGDEQYLRGWGLEPEGIHTLQAGIAPTVPVRNADANGLWANRRNLFFKPAAGYGSKATYRGDKLTRKAWDHILIGGYVAQQLVVPSERRLGPERSLKADVRNYVYDGAVLMLAARLYQGQTTNFRTQGGGFAPVLTPAIEHPEAKPIEGTQREVACTC